LYVHSDGTKGTSSVVIMSMPVSHTPVEVVDVVVVPGAAVVDAGGCVVDVVVVLDEPTHSCMHWSCVENE
jgi:hypothetical protein